MLPNVLLHHLMVEMSKHITPSLMLLCLKLKKPFVMYFAQFFKSGSYDFMP